VQRGRGLKIIVLGLDGASPMLIEEWIDQLPTLRTIKARGALGRTMPPTPAQTPVAWTTFMTGKNPGKHGIFSFATRERGSYERGIIVPAMVKSKTLWEILGGSGKEVAIINVPMSDADDGVKGLVVPGFLSQSEGIPHPSGMRGKIKRRFGVDRIRGDLDLETLNRAQEDPDGFFEKANAITEEMAEASLYLLRDGKWDFFMPVFMGLDRIQHFFWKYIDRDHPRYEESEVSARIRDFYVKFDKIVGEFMRAADEDTMVMVASDHGFCPIHTEVMVNNYLEGGGFLTVRDGRIAVEESRAISYGYGDIWLNVKGREPRGTIMPGEEYEGVRDGVIAKLQEIDIDGKSPLKSVKRREEVWWGEHLNEAPDLTAIFNPGYQAARWPEIMAKKERGSYVNENPRWSGGHDGTHDPVDVKGMIGLLGPGIGAGRDIDVHLWDVAPTILRLMGVAIPADMDGKPFL